MEHDPHIRESRGTPMTSMRFLTCFTVSFLALAQVRSAEVDPRLPGETEVVLSVNLDQLLNSPLGKKYLRTTIEEAIKGSTHGQELFKALELDPLKDIHRVTLALPAAASDAGLVIVRGKFNRERITELAEKLAADHKDKFKIHKSGDATIYEISGDKKVFATLAGDSVLLLAGSKEQLASPSKNGKPKKELIALIGKADD